MASKGRYNIKWLISDMDGHVILPTDCKLEWSSLCLVCERLPETDRRCSSDLVSVRLISRG